MTRKRIARLVFLALLAALVVAALIFTRPMTLEEIYPELDWNAVDHFCIYSQQYESTDTGTSGRLDAYHYDAELGAEDELREEFMGLLKAQTFRRKLSSFLPHGTRTQPIQEGDFKWELHFGESHGYLHLNNFFGDFRCQEMSGDGKDYDLATDKDFADKVFALITAYIEPTINAYGD